MKFKSISIIIFVFAIIILIFSRITVQAVEYSEEDSYQEQIQDYYESSGANELFSNLTDEARDMLSETGVDSIDSDAILNLSVDNILKVVWEGVLYEIKSPFVMFFNLLGVVLITAMVGTLQSSTSSMQMGQIFSVVSVLCVSSLLIAPVIEIIQGVSDSLEQVSEYMLSFIPVFAGIITASGKPLTAFAYNSVLLIVVEGFMKIATTVLIPLSGIYLSLMLISSCTDGINIGGIIKGVKTAVLWILGFIMTVFIGLLTIKSFVAKGADTVSLRAVKYLISSTIPLVGGCISDAFSVIQSSLEVIKSTVGVFGIISIIALLMPSLIKLALMSLAINIVKSVSDLLEVKKLGSLFEATSFCLSMTMSILLCFNVMLIICTSLMLVLGGGE